MNDYKTIQTAIDKIFTHTPPQVQSDYTQADAGAVDYVKNKPDLKTVATSGSYNDLQDKPTTMRAYHDSWRTDTTLEQFCQDVYADINVYVGDMYLGELTCSGLPTGMVNGEVIVYITGEPNHKLLLLSVTSTNLPPYHWEQSYFNGTLYGWNSYILSGNAQPIVITALPDDTIDTVSELDDIGLTEAEIKAASQGKRTGVIYGGEYFTITHVVYTSETQYTIAFAGYSMDKLDDQDPYIVSGSKLCRVIRNGNQVVCSSHTV